MRNMMRIYGKAATVNKRGILSTDKDIYSKSQELGDGSLALLYFAKRWTDVPKGA